MDINWCIDYLKLNANTYKLNQSNTPHHIIYWDGTNPDKQPTDAELETAWAEIEADQKATKYQRDRQPEYPPATDYLDGIVKGDQAQIDKYIADCLAVKQRHPK